MVQVEVNALFGQDPAGIHSAVAGRKFMASGVVEKQILQDICLFPLGQPALAFLELAEDGLGSALDSVPRYSSVCPSEIVLCAPWPLCPGSDDNKLQGPSDGH
jgi:hypothetical protein